MAHTIKAVAGMAGVTVRTLHHYDEIGLLRPAAVSAAGYRLYSDADLERLQHILFFRELGFSLDDIRAITSSPNFDPREALRSHRKLLVEKQKRIKRLVRSLDRTLDALERGTLMEKNEMFEGFDDTTMEQYREEASQRWGKETVDASYRRWNRLTKEQQQEMIAQGKVWVRQLATLMDRDPGDLAVQAMIADHHRSINENFYDCSLEVYRGLGNLYVDDSRFTAYYDDVQPGLAAFMRSAMHVYVDRQEAAAR